MAVAVAVFICSTIDAVVVAVAVRVVVTVAVAVLSGSMIDVVVDTVAGAVVVVVGAVLMGSTIVTENVLKAPARSRSLLGIFGALRTTRAE